MKRVVVFFGTLVFFAALAWIGGFNFDTRGFMVGYFTFTAVGLSIIIAILSDL